MISLKSIDPIRKAVGSKDRAILNALLHKIGEYEEFRSYAEDMIMGSPRKQEPGCWNCFVEMLATHFGLSPQPLPLEDWKHYHVWKEYRAMVDPLLSKNAKKLLKFLDVGRPFLGSAIDNDGSLFAWLTTAEVNNLLDELADIDAETLDDELDDFHEQLVESLQETADRDADLFLSAS